LWININSACHKTTPQETTCSSSTLVHHWRSGWGVGAGVRLSVCLSVIVCYHSLAHLKRRYLRFVRADISSKTVVSATHYQIPHVAYNNHMETGGDGRIPTFKVRGQALYWLTPNICCKCVNFSLNFKKKFLDFIPKLRPHATDATIIYYHGGYCSPSNICSQMRKKIPTPIHCDEEKTLPTFPHTRLRNDLQYYVSIEWDDKLCSITYPSTVRTPRFVSYISLPKFTTAIAPVPRLRHPLSSYDTLVAFGSFSDDDHVSLYIMNTMILPGVPYLDSV